MSQQGLTDGDRSWLEERFKELKDDSTRQWIFSNKLNTELQVHVANSNSRHQLPCATSQAAMKDHLDSHHNLTKKVKAVGIWAVTAGAIAEAIHWLHRVFEK